MNNSNNSNNSSNVENNSDSSDSSDSRVIKNTMDVHRLQIKEEYGVNVLDQAYKQYVYIITLEKHYFRCNKYSEAYINANFDMKDVERKFLGLMESEYGIGQYYHAMLLDYCETKYKERIIEVNDERSMEFFLMKLTDAETIQRAIRRLEYQMGRLPFSVFNIGTTQYEIYGEYIEMCVHDLKILLNYAE